MPHLKANCRQHRSTLKKTKKEREFVGLVKQLLQSAPWEVTKRKKITEKTGSQFHMNTNIIQDFPYRIERKISSILSRALSNFQRNEAIFNVMNRFLEISFDSTNSNSTFPFFVLDIEVRDPLSICVEQWKIPRSSNSKFNSFVSSQWDDTWIYSYSNVKPISCLQGEVHLHPIRVCLNYLGRIIDHFSLLCCV